MEPIRLWRTHEMVVPSDEAIGRPEWHEERVADETYAYPDTEYAALPRAKYDALAAEAAEARTLRAERDSLVKERDEANERADGNFASYRRAVESLSAATARAEKAEARIANIERIASEQYAALRGRAERAEALLREARAMLADAAGIAARYYSDDQVGCLCVGECACVAGRANDFGAKHDELAARIDAILDTPAEADRRGEDGA